MDDLLKSGTFWTAVGSIATVFAAIAAIAALLKKTGHIAPPVEPPLPSPKPGGPVPPKPDVPPERMVYLQGDATEYPNGEGGACTVSPGEQMSLVEYGEQFSRVRKPNHPHSFKVHTYRLSWDRSGTRWITFSYRKGPVYYEGQELFLLLFGEKESRVEEPSGGRPSFKRQTRKLSLDVGGTKSLLRDSFPRGG